MLLARLDAAPNQSGGDIMTVRTALEIATLGGAAVLGRDDIGSLEPGKTADFIALDMSKLEYAGAQSDMVAATLLAAPTTVSHNYVGGNAVVADGHLVNLEMEPLIERHNQLAAELLA
jgi:cytosine/adenosine deaminase-related metal-dependent hydrolase